MSEQWMAEPLISADESHLRLEQAVKVGNVLAHDSIDLVRYDDGDVRFMGSNGDTVVIPAHWLPVVNEWLLRNEVSA